MELSRKIMLYVAMCIFFIGCNNGTEEHKMQQKIEKGFDGDIPEDNIAKGFKGDNTAKELRSVEKAAKKEEEKTQQDGIQEELK